MLTADNLPVPFYANVTGGLPHGGELDITGDAIHGHDRGIWLEYKTMDGTALHLNIRMGQNNQHLTVVNSYQHGRWGHEEKHYTNVVAGGSIHIHVECHHNHYEISVNGRQFRFPYRLKKCDVNRLEVRGDILIRRMVVRKMEGHIQLVNNYPAAYPQVYPTSTYPAAPPYGAPQTYPPPYYPTPNQPGYPSLGQPQPYVPNTQAGLGQPPPSGFNYYRS